MEYVIWGIPPGQSDETVLYTRAETMERAEQAAALLASRHGCCNLRIQVIDLSRDISKDWGSNPIR